MRKLISKILQWKRISIDKVLIINYYKVDKIPKIEAGYIDVETVAKRYERSAKDLNLVKLLAETSVHDNFYFLEHECSKYWLNLPKNSKMLDVGCGNGFYSKAFKREDSPLKNLHYTGTEIAPEIVEVCKKYNPDCDFILSLADKINSKDDSFELVYCSSTIHYTLDKWKESIKEMARVSNKFIAITRFPISKYHKTFYVHQTVRGISGTENHFFIVINREEMENYFQCLGLKILKRDYSSEEYGVSGVDEKIMLVQYLLEKND